MIAVKATSTVAHYECALFEIVHGRAHRRTMGLDDPGGVRGVDCHQDRDWPWGRYDEVIPYDGCALTRAQHSRDHVRVSSVTAAAQPPARSPVAQAVQLVGGVVGEIRDVVRTTRQQTKHGHPFSGPNGRLEL